MPKKKKIIYRKYNYFSKEGRIRLGVVVDPAIAEGIISIAREEKRTISWVLEEILADYFNVEVQLKECKRTRPRYE